MSYDPTHESDIPRMARRFLESVQSHEHELREEMKTRLRFYVGDQWDEREKARRDAKSRPYIVLNECAPPISQIETDIRLNPPGPICHPVGSGADSETADVIAGLIRQAEYASDAKQAYVMAGKHSAISGYGILEWGTRYCDDRSLDQELYVIPNPDPSLWYFDPLARGQNREDALVALKGPRILSKEAYEEAYGVGRKVLNRNSVESFTGNVQQMFGWSGDAASINTWTSGGKGPYWVAEFWRITVKLRKFRVYTDNVGRFDSEAKKLPSGVVPKTDADGDDSEFVRSVPERVVTKYVVDACEVLAKTEWIGDQIPALAILGPETYIDGKLHRGSLVAGMIDGNRGLNYVGTAMLEISGKLPRAPWVGAKGQFDDIGDDGRNKWAHANTEDYAWLAYEPVQLVDEVSGRAAFAPPPQRNMMEAPIQWCLALAQFFKEAIQAASAYSATSLGKRKADQSGEAIKALQAESNKGTFSYPDGVNSGVAVMYQQWLKIFPKIMDEARAATIITADGENEQKLINQEFDHPTKPGEKMRHNITLGRYSVRVDAGPSLETRTQATQGSLESLFKAAPQLLQLPGVAAAYLRLLGDGNPKTDQIADMLPGGQGDEPNPQQLQAQLQQAQQQNQQLQQGLQQLHAAMEAQLPKLEVDKFKAQLAALTAIRVAEIGAGVDRAQMDADRLETFVGLAHDAATQATDREHQKSMADRAAQAQSALSSQGASQAADAAEAAQQNEPGSRCQLTF